MNTLYRCIVVCMDIKFVQMTAWACNYLLYILVYTGKLAAREIIVNIFT